MKSRFSNRNDSLTAFHVVFFCILAVCLSAPPTFAATLSGTVYQGDGVTPLTGTSINIGVITGTPCMGHTHQWIDNVPINQANGTFSLTVSQGTYFLWTVNNGSNFVNEWWAASSSSFNCANAESITVSESDVLTGIDFQLDTGATISGTVYQSDGVTPVTGDMINMAVDAGDPCAFVQSVGNAATSPSDGTYTIVGVPAGTVWLNAHSGGMSTYTNEWWASPASSWNCGDAQSIATNPGDALTGHDFQLELGGTISGTLYEADGVTPITETSNNIALFSGDPCSQIIFIVSTSSDPADGTYTIKGVPPGNYYLQADRGDNPTLYLNEWWRLRGVRRTVRALRLSQSVPAEISRELIASRPRER